MPRPVLLPDSNVWIYLIDRGGIETLYRESRRLGVAVAACPAVGFEFLRAENLGEKRRRMKVLGRSGWLRLMPEAFKEAAEARAAIEYRRPGWINPNPSLGIWNALSKDWKSGWWYRAKNDTEAEAARVGNSEGDRLRQAREQADFARDQARGARVTFDTVSFDLHVVPAGPPPPWWDGRPVEPWRLQFATGLFEALETPGHPYRDWLDPWLIGTIEDIDWYRLWFREVTKEEMPLAWLRWAFAHVQATRKTTNGGPVDNQIATYLPECDVFVTADKVFVECVEKVRSQSPVRLGNAARVPADGDALDGVMAALMELAA